MNTVGAYAKSNTPRFLSFDITIDGRTDSIFCIGNETWEWLEHTWEDKYLIQRKFSIVFNTSEECEIETKKEDFSRLPGGGIQECMIFRSKTSNAWAEVTNIMVLKGKENEEISKSISTSTCTGLES